MKRIIYDFGANTGNDIPYYLKKADVVVAVEANPRFASQSSPYSIMNCLPVSFMSKTVYSQMESKPKSIFTSTSGLTAAANSLGPKIVILTILARLDFHRHRQKA